MKVQAIDGKPLSAGGKLLKASAGGTSIDLGVTGAAVGDIIKVAAVDADGKPTAWEAAGDKWEKIADVALVADTPLYELANFGVWRKIKVLLSRAAYVSGLNENVWFRLAQIDTAPNTHALTEVFVSHQYGYRSLEVNAEFGDTFAYTTKITGNNLYSPDAKIQNVAVPVENLDPNDYVFRIFFQNGGTVIQDGDAVAVYGVKR